LDLKNAIRYYLRSTPNKIVTALALLALAAGVLLFSHVLLPIALITVSAWCLVTILALFTKAGVRGIVAEREEERAESTRQKIQSADETRDRIAYLRIGDEGVRKALEYFLVVSGEYLQKCRELSQFSPAANEKISQVLEICQIYLKDLDESSTEKRYEIEEDPNIENSADRTARLIREYALEIKKRSIDDFPDITLEEKMEILEEMNREDNSE